MLLDNEINVNAPPAEVFALINDVERVVTCLPGAALTGRDGDTYTGGVKVKVGPISAAYTGTVRFLDIDTEQRRLRLVARGSDSRGSGDAEAEVKLSVDESPTGSLLRLHTDLLIRGKIAQFGKGAISTVSAKLLDQFAVNLAGLLSQPEAAPATAPGGPAPAAAPAAPAAVPAAGTGELDGLAMMLGPAAKYVPVVGAFAVGVFQGWLLGKVSTQAKLLKKVRND